MVDVRESAERVKQGPSVASMADFGILAAAWLTENDPTPIDESWLNAKLERRPPGPDGFECWALPKHNGGIRVLKIDDRFDVEIYSFSPNGNVHLRDKNLAVGAIEAICRVLQIEL